MDVGEEGLGPAGLHDQRAAVLEAVAHGGVAAEAQFLGAPGDLAGLAGEDGGEELEEAHALEAQRVVALLLNVDEEFWRKKIRVRECKMAVQSLIESFS